MLSGPFLAQHAEYVRKSAISPDVASARGYRSLTKREELRELGFQPRQGGIPALAIPIHDVRGHKVYALIRPDKPRLKKGRAILCEQPQGSVLKIDVPPPALAKLSDVKQDLWVTDCPEQADALVSSGRVAIAILGHRAWRHFRRTNLGRPALSDWDAVNLADRNVVVAFSSDVFASSGASVDLSEFRAFLRGRGAKVRHATVTASSDGEKKTISDALLNGEDIDKLVSDPRGKCALVPAVGAPVLDHPYHAGPNGFFLDVAAGDEVISRQLTNWDARIVGDILFDDGLEQRRLFDVEADVNGRTQRFHLRPSEFEDMAWPLARLGPRAIIFSGYGVKDHIRAAIQLFSDNICRRRVLAHTGWAHLNGQWGFLHAGGVIWAANSDTGGQLQCDRPMPKPIGRNELSCVGPVGPLSGEATENLSAQLPDELARFCLPDPPAPDIAANRVDIALGFLRVAEDRISYPLLALVARAIIGPTNFSVHLVGHTGVLKTALATVVQQFFGAGLDVDHLVGHWQGTANSLESLAFHLKDMLLLVDDFSPTGGRGDIQKAHREAERLLRAKGNAGGRSRCRPDGTFKAARSPRATLLLTGEDVPEGHSLRARLLTIEVQEGDIDPEHLKYCQDQCAATGLYSEFLAAYIQWLAPRYEMVQDRLQYEREEWKTTTDIPKEVHRRTYHAARELEFGFNMLLDFALECNAITEDWQNDYRTKCWGALESVIWSQEQHQRFANPVDQFKYLLAALFASKKVHVVDAGTYGPPTQDPEAWGYRKKIVPVTEGPQQHEEQQADSIVASTFEKLLQVKDTQADIPEAWHLDAGIDLQREAWVPSGTKIGWVSPGTLDLIPEITFAEVQSLACRTGAPLPLTVQMLEKRLADAGIVQRDVKRNRIRHRVSVEGSRQYVLRVPVQWLSSHPGWGFPDEDHEEDQDIPDLLQLPEPYQV